MFTRLCLNKFLVFFIIFVIKTSYANNFSAEYKVSTTGIKIGNFSWSLNINDNIYQTELNLKNSGIFHPYINLKEGIFQPGLLKTTYLRPRVINSFGKQRRKQK